VVKSFAVSRQRRQRDLEPDDHDRDHHADVVATADRLADRAAGYSANGEDSVV
jgi:hypothetical protein